MAPTAQLYVYYRVPNEHLAAARQAFERARAGAAVQLLRRVDETGSAQTWMEIYGPEQLSLEPALAEAMASWVVGERHRERFEPLA